MALVGIDRASAVLAEAFPSTADWNQPEVLRRQLWRDDRSRRLFEIYEAAVMRLPDVTAGQRKGYSAFSRTVQFTAARPLGDGQVLVGLAVGADAHARLAPRNRHERWSERLSAQLTLTSGADVDPDFEGLLHAAWAGA